MSNVRHYTLKNYFVKKKIIHINFSYNRMKTQITLIWLKIILNIFEVFKVVEQNGIIIAWPQVA